MRRLVAYALAVCIALAAGSTGAAAAAGDDAGWSEVSNGLRARLFMRRSHVSNGTGVIVTQVELSNVREVRNPMVVNLDESITYGVTDADGRVVATAGLPFNGGTFDKLDLVLPFDSSTRFRVGPCGCGIPGDQAALVDLGPKFSWSLPRDGKDYYLGAVLEIARPKELDRNARWPRWDGRVVLPRVRIPTEPEPFDPATLGPLIDELGAKMFGENWDAAEAAARRMSLIDDPRVIPWYVKAVKTKSYDLKSHALDRLSRVEGDAALEALKIAMTTKGDDIGNCTTADVAASRAANIRHAAAIALARSPHKQAKTLLFAMEEDAYMGVRLTVLQTAARMDTPESLALLKRRTQDADEMVRGEAVRLLELREKGTPK